MKHVIAKMKLPYEITSIIDAESLCESCQGKILSLRADTKA